MTDHALLHAITDKIDQKLEENFQPNEVDHTH